MRSDPEPEKVDLFLAMSLPVVREKTKFNCSLFRINGVPEKAFVPEKADSLVGLSEQM